MFNCRLQSGITLFELMIAMSLSVILLTGLFEAYVINSKANNLLHTINELKIRSVAASEILEPSLQLAGYDGCRYHSRGIFSNHDNELTSEYMEFPTNRVINISNDHTQIETTLVTKIKINDTLVIADCRSSEIVKVNKIKVSNGKQIIHTDSPIKHDFDSSAVVGKLIHQHFYTTRGKNAALMMEDLHHRHTTLVKGITNLHVSYYFLTNHQIKCIPIEQIHDWRALMGIAIDLDIRANTITKPWHLFIAKQHGNDDAR